MALIRCNTSGGGGSETKYASGYYASSVPSSITTTDDTTGETFEPKILMFVTIYSSSHTVLGVYDKNTSDNSYTRVYDGTETTISLPSASNYTGLGSVTSTGFTLNQTSNMTKFAYIAIG